MLINRRMRSKAVEPLWLTVFQGWEIVVYSLSSSPWASHWYRHCWYKSKVIWQGPWRKERIWHESWMTRLSQPYKARWHSGIIIAARRYFTVPRAEQECLSVWDTKKRGKRSHRGFVYLLVRFLWLVQNVWDNVIGRKSRFILPHRFGGEDVSIWSIDPIVSDLQWALWECWGCPNHLIQDEMEVMESHHSLQGRAANC